MTDAQMKENLLITIVKRIDKRGTTNIISNLFFCDEV